MRRLAKETDIRARILSAYKIAHLDDAAGGTALATADGDLFAVFGDRAGGVLPDATSRSDLDGRLATTTTRAGGATAGRAGLALVLEDLVEGLAELRSHC